MKKPNDEHKDVILEFRQRYDIARKSGLKKGEIVNRSKLTNVIIKSLLEDDIQAINIRMSTRAKIQDFNKWVTNHCAIINSSEEELSQEEIDAEYYSKFPEEKKNHIFENAIKNSESAPPLKHGNGILNYMVKGSPEEPASLKGKTVGDPLTDEELEFYRKLGEAHKLKPNNCTITINLY